MDINMCTLSKMAYGYACDSLRDPVAKIVLVAGIGISAIAVCVYFFKKKK